MKLTSHLHLVSRLRMHVAIPPLPQYVFMAGAYVMDMSHGIVLS